MLKFLYRNTIILLIDHSQIIKTIPLVSTKLQPKQKDTNNIQDTFGSILYSILLYLI